MACKHCQAYMAKAIATIPDFEAACALVNINPRSEVGAEKLVREFGNAGQFGTIRLARTWPDITDEVQFRMLARVTRDFYWMMLDYWADQAKERVHK